MSDLKHAMPLDSGTTDFEAAMARATREGASGIIATPDPVTFLHRKRLAEAALKYRLPGIYWAREYVEDGGLLTYSADATELRRRAATFVDKILKGQSRPTFRSSCPPSSSL